jgi:hypothetical protein
MINLSFTQDVIILTLTHYLQIFSRSPMGHRCQSLHDPRVEGCNAFWLDRCVKPKRKELCVIPDALYHHRENSMFQHNPIVDYHTSKQFGNESNAFETSYNLVCNNHVPVFDKRFVLPVPSRKLSNVQKLCIVRAMQAGNGPAYHNFTYQNKQSLQGQPCMILQTRYFRLPKLNTRAPINLEDIVHEVSSHEYNQLVMVIPSMMVRADEIVFESKGKHNCNRSIWFDACISSSNRIAKQDMGYLQSCNDKGLFCMPKNYMFQTNLPSITPHILMQPKDDCKEGYQLIDSILKDLISKLLTDSEYICNYTGDIDALQADFDRLQNTNKAWSWPALSNEDMSKIFQKTREEHTSNAYVPHAEKANDVLPSIWSAFCSTLNDVEATMSKPRLDVFCTITSKHTNGDVSYDAKDAKVARITNSFTTFVSRHSEDTWKELLMGNDGAWHRAKAHSKKVC